MKLEVKGSDWVLAHPKKSAMLAAWPELEASVKPIIAPDPQNPGQLVQHEQGRLVLVDTDVDPPEIIGLDPNLDETVVTVVTKATGSPGGGPVITPPGRG